MLGSNPSAETGDRSMRAVHYCAAHIFYHHTLV